MVVERGADVADVAGDGVIDGSGIDGAGSVVDGLVALAGQLAETDLDGLGAEELDRLVVGAVVAHQRVLAQVCRLVDRWDKVGVWLADGSRSAGHRLARDVHASPRTMKRLVRLAGAAAHMPRVFAAWAAGELSLDHVDLFAEARGNGREALFAECEAELVGEVRPLRFDQAVKLVAYWKVRADALLHPDGSPPVVDPWARWSTTFDAVVHVDALLDPVGGAMVVEALRRIERELWRGDQRQGLRRPQCERNAAALVEMAVRASATPGGGRRPEPLVVVLLGQESFGGLCELSNGHVISPGSLVPHLDALQVQSLVFDGADRAVRGSPSRAFTGMLRRVVQARDRHCQHTSGCDEAIVGCDVDHVVAWVDGGVTTQDNGRLLCEVHNRNARLRNPRPWPHDVDVGSNGDGADSRTNQPNAPPEP